MGVLPTDTPESAASALSFIAETPGLHGVVTGPRIAGYAFDDRRLDPFWEELSRLDLPLFVHPEDGVAIEDLKGYRHTLPVGVGFPVETTIALSRFIFGGVATRHPGLRILAAHGGGTLPYLAGRLDAAWRSDDDVRARLDSAPSSLAKRLYLDSLVYYGPALEAAARLVGTDHLMFGSDHPFSVSDPEANLKTITQEMKTDTDRKKVMGANAIDFFGLETKVRV